MSRVELVENLSCRPKFSVFRVFKALTDSFLCIGVGGNVEQMLIRFSVLNDGRSLAIHRKHHGALTFFQLFHKVTRPATEGRQRLDRAGQFFGEKAALSPNRNYSNSKTAVAEAARGWKYLVIE
jgi:hypothetical protein